MYIQKKKNLAPIRTNKQHSDQREDSRPVITEYNLMTLNYDFTAASSYTARPDHQISLSVRNHFIIFMPRRALFT